MPTVPPTIYATFVGLINQETVGHAIMTLNNATFDNVTDVHIMFQTIGGSVGDGFALFSYWEACPMRIHLYNGGAVQSAGVLAYLGGNHRYTSAHATFMIHRTTHLPTSPVGVETYRAIAQSLTIDDGRMRTLLDARTKVSADRYALSDLTLTAQEAIDLGIAQEIRDFKVPPGNQIFNLTK